MARYRRPYRRPQAPFPKDFAARIERLKDTSGLSWREFARRVGTDLKRVKQWRLSVRPSAKYMLSLFRFATATPGGLEILLGESAHPNLETAPETGATSDVDGQHASGNFGPAR